MKWSYQEVRKLCLKPDEATKPAYARYVTHTFSTRLIWLIQDLSISPNMITLMSLVVAFAAFPFFVVMTPASVLMGMFLIELYYVLDAVDGQWARFKNTKSLTGAFFDYLVNYAIHPPLLFAISWGVFLKTKIIWFVLLGFIAAFSTLWIILIWDLRASILLARTSLPEQVHLKTTPQKQPEDQSATSIFRRAFSWLHKVTVFPWLMNVLTLTSILSFVCFWIFNGQQTATVFFATLLLFYAICGPLVAVALTVHWILARTLDSPTSSS